MSIKLTYFNVRGLGELARYVLHLSGTEWEDHRYPIDVAAGYAKPEFDADKAAGKFPISMGRLPILYVDGMEIAESKPIARFVARKFGFMGANDIEAAQVDCIGESVNDINTAYQKVRSLPDAEKAAATEKWFATELAEWYGKLEGAINVTSKASGCSVGSKISLADIQLYYFVTQFFDDKEGSLKACDHCPHIKAIIAAVSANEKVKEWEAKRPVTAI